MRRYDGLNRKGSDPYLTPARLSCRDSAILAAALELGCHTFYCEDLDHGQTYAGVRVSDPFAG